MGTACHAPRTTPWKYARGDPCFASSYMNKVRSMVARRGNKGKDTKAVFVNILTWSFGALAMGKFSAKDWQGNPWPKDSPGDKLKNMDLAGGP